MRHGAVIALAAAFPFIAIAHPGSGIAVSGKGEVFFVHTGAGVMKVNRDGVVSRYAEPGFHFMIADPGGAFVSQRWPKFPDGEIRSVGTDPKLLLGSSFPMAIAPEGAFYYPVAGTDDKVRIMRTVAGASPVEFATLPAAIETGANGKQTRAKWIHGLTAGRDGTLYYTEQNAVQRIDGKGMVSLVAGDIAVPDCVSPFAKSDAPRGPLLRGLDAAPDGSLYVAASGCRALLKITPAGAVSVVLRASDSWTPTGVALAGDDVYVLEFRFIEVERAEDWLPRVRKLSKDGAVTVVATVSKTTASESHATKPK